uniref:Uncharacterized protein n=1 Tax=Strombidium rassoulzadegani TaxID=1082188 RepID=A0A7S3FTK5_9SPIT|mmetsp:Transcript_14527/g.24791  ORF Transcript_14527/g.24791 Transcript_14527/m.24791 type:complete len:124 (+) Transcript_14527:1106-1477(+)
MNTAMSFQPQWSDQMSQKTSLLRGSISELRQFKGYKNTDELRESIQSLKTDLDDLFSSIKNQLPIDATKSESEEEKNSWFAGVYDQEKQVMFSVLILSTLLFLTSVYMMREDEASVSRRRHPY